MLNIFKSHLTHGQAWGSLYFLCGYIPGRIADDALSSSILDLKRNVKPVTEMWTDFAIEGLKSLGIGEGDLLIRALGHRETTTDTVGERLNPMGDLCRKVEAALGCRYVPGLIEKRTQTISLKCLSKEERWKEIGDSYRVNTGLQNAHFQRIWLLDDIVTTGATVQAIWQALLAVWPVFPFNVFTLARTTRDTESNASIALEGEHVSWKDGAMIVHEPVMPYSRMLTKDDLVTPEFDDSDTLFQMP